LKLELINYYCHNTNFSLGLTLKQRLRELRNGVLDGNRNEMQFTHSLLGKKYCLSFLCCTTNIIVALSLALTSLMGMEKKRNFVAVLMFLCFTVTLQCIIVFFSIHNIFYPGSSYVYASTFCRVPANQNQWTHGSSRYCALVSLIIMLLEFEARYCILMGFYNVHKTNNFQCKLSLQLWALHNYCSIP